MQTIRDVWWLEFEPGDEEGMGTDLMASRIAVVTGAGRGIGFGIAERLAGEGAHVVIAELVEERGQEAAARLVAQGSSAEAVQLDVSDSASCAAMTADVVERHGRIDVLVNNAGLFRLHKSEDMPEEDWRIQIDVMLTGTFLCTQAVGRVMIEQGGGSIVNIASIGGMGGWPMRSAYNAAKAGVINLTEVLATEWAHYGVRINAVSPGVTRTDMMDEALQKGDADEAKFDQRTPMGRIAEVSEIADAVTFLASDRASYVTGQNLRVDGGWVPWGNLEALGFPEADAEAEA